MGQLHKSHVKFTMQGYIQKYESNWQLVSHNTQTATTDLLLKITPETSNILFIL
jgi:hypothetical protein